MSQVTSMVAMFSATGLEVAEKVTVLGMGIGMFRVSKILVLCSVSLEKMPK